MYGADSHVKSLTMADWTGTVTHYDSRGTQISIAATDLFRPSDWNSAHDVFATIFGNTSGQSTVSGTNVVLAGGNNIMLSAATAAGAATITISQFDGPISRFTARGAEGVTLSSVSGGIASLSLRVFSVPAQLSFSRVDIPVFVSIDTTKSSTAARAISSAFVIYSRNGSTLSPIVGVTGQRTISWVSSTGSYTGITGGRYLSFGVATNLSPGEYFAGFSFSTASSSIGTATRGGVFSLLMSLQQLNADTNLSVTAFNKLGQAVNASTNSWFGGIYSNSITATNQTLAQSNFTVTGTQQFLANTPLIFRGA